MAFVLRSPLVLSACLLPAAYNCCVASAAAASTSVSVSAFASACLWLHLMNA